jgi:hypothetical protein
MWQDLERGSLVSAPYPQFAKDSNGKRKLQDGFFKGPYGMMLIKKYPWVVYDVDRDEGRLPTKLYCMQRHTYARSGLRKGDRLRDDHHLHVKLIPPGGDKKDKGDAPHDPLIVQEVYNRKPIAQSAYLEFKNIVVIEVNEHVELDGHLEPDSWFHLFDLHAFTIFRAVANQLESMPIHKEHAKAIVRNLANTFIEKLEGAAGMVSANRLRITALNEATPRAQMVHGERNNRVSSTSTSARNQLIETSNVNISQQATEVRHPPNRSGDRTRRGRIGSPHAADLEERDRERVDRAEGIIGSRSGRTAAHDHEDNRTRRPERDWRSGGREDRHTLGDSRLGSRNRRADYDEDFVQANNDRVGREYRKGGRQRDRSNGREQERGRGMYANQRDGGPGRSGRRA